MDVAIALTVFPVIFVAELPDKTMFASLLLAARGRPVAVWAGAALAFSVHVVIAVTVGAALFALLPHRVVEGVVALMFLAAAVLAFRASSEADDEEEAVVRGSGRTIATAFGMVFVAEWGDLTQILTATLAAHYHAPLTVAAAALLALWAVAALAVSAGGLLERLPVSVVRRLTGVLLLALAVLAALQAATGGALPL